VSRTPGQAHDSNQKLLGASLQGYLVERQGLQITAGDSSIGNTLSSRLAIWQVHDTDLDEFRVNQEQGRASYQYHASGQWPPARGIPWNKVQIPGNKQSTMERMKATKVDRIQDANQWKGCLRSNQLQEMPSPMRKGSPQMLTFKDYAKSVTCWHSYRINWDKWTVTSLLTKRS
jgi:hypothetical protein